MALYKKLRADFMLVDDKRARKVASLNDIEIIGSQGVLLFAKQQGLIKKIKPFIDKSYEVYMALYQGVSGVEEWKNIYKQFSPDFFDLIIVDECHRGSAAEDSAWREILEYYSSATQIGMTATPKETKYISNIHYFGEPLYLYSLKQGIEDGFLAPYKVIRIAMGKDAGWRPEDGKVDKHGYEIPDQIYNMKDYDRNLVLEKRTERVAEKVQNRRPAASLPWSELSYPSEGPFGYAQGGQSRMPWART